MLTPTYSCHTPPAVPEYSAIALAGLGMRQPNQRGGVPKAHLAGGRGWGWGAEAIPCLTKVWLVSRRISQPSMIMRSMARFFRMFSVSLTSSCIILWGQERTVRDGLPPSPRLDLGRKPGTQDSQMELVAMKRESADT